MGQILHGSARTTVAIRRAIQRSQESLLTLATRHGINPKTVAKWRKRPSVEDARMGPDPASTVLTPEQEACAVAFRRHTLLPLDDCLYALQATIPQLTRSSLHRCFQRHGISRLPLSQSADQPTRKKFKDYPIGYLHIDFAEVYTQEGKQYLFVAIDRTSKVAFAELQPRATKTLAADFLRRVLTQLPYQVHKVLTDNGIQFGNMPHQPHAMRHLFDRVCDQHGIEHRFTKPAHPWTNGQVERMNRTLKEATVGRYYYQTTQELNEHLQTFLLAYNHAKRLKTLRGLTPHEFVCAQWQKNPAIFTRDPTQLTLGLYSYLVAEWGEPLRTDMTHSVTKSFLSTVVGLAVEQGLIRSVHDTVAPYVPPIEVYGQPTLRTAEELGQAYLLQPFATPHNRTITWDHLLRQTSDWEGTLWGKPDWADRPSAKAAEWLDRPRHRPGSVYEYNDVRVNALALAATSVWRQPLPQVLKTHLMDPIGASNTWRWTGYRNSWIVLDGHPVQSVSGGGHWGGGMFISAFDMARFGLLSLHRGRWNGKQLIPESWVAQALTPTPAQPTYGFMNWFLNTDHQYLPSAPLKAFVHVGNGTNAVYVDPDHELVMVVRWIDNKALDGMVKAVLEAFPTR